MSFSEINNSIMGQSSAFSILLLKIKSGEDVKYRPMLTFIMDSVDKEKSKEISLLTNIFLSTPRASVEEALKSALKFTTNFYNTIKIVDEDGKFVEEKLDFTLGELINPSGVKYYDMAPMTSILSDFFFITVDTFDIEGEICYKPLISIVGKDDEGLNYAFTIVTRITETNLDLALQLATKAGSLITRGYKEDIIIVGLNGVSNLLSKKVSDYFENMDSEDIQVRPNYLH